MMIAPTWCASLVVVLCSLTACQSTSDTEGTICEGLFGRPNASTGLDSSQCSTACACGDASWQAYEYDASAVEALEARVLLNPPDLLDADPYDNAEAHPEKPDEFCAVVPDSTDPSAYRLHSFMDLSTMESEDGVLTHYGACGACSSLRDLAVYIRHEDLTGPVRQCGLLGFSEGANANMQCLLDLGFTAACAQIWYYNTAHTRSACLLECLVALDDPYNLEDGSLNPCLQCDEDRSGPVFKAVAGRTRRNSGLASALCRPCSTVKPFVHVYP